MKEIAKGVDFVSMQNSKSLEELTLHDFLNLLASLKVSQKGIAAVFHDAFLSYAEEVQKNDPELFREIQKEVHNKNRDSSRKKSRTTKKDLILFDKNYPCWEKYPIVCWESVFSNATIGRIIGNPDYKPRKNYALAARCLRLVLDQLPECQECNVAHLNLSIDSTFQGISTALKKRGFDLTPYDNIKSQMDKIAAIYDAMAAAAALSVVAGLSSPTIANDGNEDRPVPNAVRPATYTDLLLHNWTKESIAEALVAGDYETYEIDAANEGTPSQWQEFLSGYPETFQYLVTEDFKEIAGNFSFVSLTPEQAELALEGKLYEADLSPDQTRDLFSPATDHILFLLNLSLRDSFSETKNHLLLRKMFLSQILSFAENGIFFRSIIMSAHRKTEEAFLRSWGFKHIIDHEKTGKIYALDMIPFPCELDQALKRYLDLGSIREDLKRLYNSVPIAVHAEEDVRVSYQFSLSGQDNTLEDLLEEAIVAYLENETSDASSLSDEIDNLPPTRGTAVALLKMTELFACLEIYEPLFKRYKAFLTEEELYVLTQRAKDTWDPFVLKGWGIQSGKRFF